MPSLGPMLGSVLQKVPIVMSLQTPHEPFMARNTNPHWYAIKTLFFQNAKYSVMQTELKNSNLIFEKYRP